MPIAEFGQKVSFGFSKFTKLKAKGDKIQFRIIKAPMYEGKHFLKTEDGFDVVPCERVNLGNECEYCVRFFKAKAHAKKEGLDQKEANKLSDPWKASVSYFFPIINRETESFEVFQTAMSVRDKIESQIELGTKILERDLIVKRDENPGTAYYSLSVVDSSETKPLTEKEKQELEIGKKVDLNDYVHGKEDEGEIAIAANEEVVDDDVAPF